MFKVLPPGPPKETIKVDDYTWEIPKTYKKGMNVPARIIASKKLLDQMDGQVFDQMTNVACMPGILNQALCMPDAHSGYGIAIGGVAAFDANTGVISPGAVGFDINCLHPETKILTKEGYYKPIKDFSKKFSQENLSSIKLDSKQKISAKPYLFIAKHYDQIYEITTNTGKKISSSGDHPLLTDNGMITAEKLKVGSTLFTNPFIGIAYEPPQNKTILTKEKIRETIGNRYKLIRELEKNDLLPLKYNSKKIPILAKLVGFLTGDGWIGTYYSKKRKQEVWSMRVIGKKEDLNEIQKDLKELGYESNYLTTKEYTSKITQLDGQKRTIKGHSCQLYINSQSLAVLLHMLGVPEGNKSRSATTIPNWIKNAPLWIKRLYLAGLFGAELTKPLQRKNENKTFTEPSFSQNKIEKLGIENLKFMTDLISILNEFGVKTNKVYRQEGILNVHGERTHKLALRLSAKPENLMKLWSTIGFEYCKERKELSAVAIAYLQYKEVQQTEYDIISQGNQQLKTKQKIITFSDFKEKFWIPNTEIVKDTIRSIQKKPYHGPLYDFTLDDENHNFIANSIISSNCGMKLITTNLTHEEIKPHLRNLVDELFKTVPTGVGCKGFVKVDKNQFKNVCEEGVKWCIDNGYGREDDLKKTESHGRIEWADTSKISDKAIKRGIDQLGTLGSGNHYLEIQVAHENQIFDKKIAKAFGIKEEHVVVMVHCGSRGFGHQVATDYLKVFDNAMNKYKISVPDRELACAPFSSPEGQDYYKAMACAANMAFANRQVIMHRIREAFSKITGRSETDLGMNLVYDVAHNIAKVEKYKIDGSEKEVIVHRKGSTRAYGPGQKELPEAYKEFGQPVILGGSMETGSYLLVGTQKAMDTTFGSTAHGSGRTMSRTQAKKEIRGEELQESMEKQGIYVKSKSMSGLAEEAGKAYKPITDVVEALEGSGISKAVAGLKPIGNIKG